jgi:molecular chaperone GrpE
VHDHEQTADRVPDGAVPHTGAPPGAASAGGAAAVSASPEAPDTVQPLPTDPPSSVSMPTLPLQELGGRVEALAVLVAESNRLAQDRERIIDRLHDENQRLKAGETQRLLIPVLRDLMGLFDELNRAQLHTFRDVVSDILYRHGVERFDAEPNAAFEPRIHKASKAVPTEDPARDRCIARVVRVGFKNEERVLRPLEAEVYRHTPRKD